MTLLPYQKFLIPGMVLFIGGIVSVIMGLIFPAISNMLFNMGSQGNAVLEAELNMLRSLSFMYTVMIIEGIVLLCVGIPLMAVGIHKKNTEL